MNYAKALRIVRAAKGWSQQELAFKADISKSLISKIESGNRDLTDKIKKQLSDAMNVPENIINILALEKEKEFSLKNLEDIGKALLAINEHINSEKI